MKNLLLVAALVLSSSLLAGTPDFRNLTKESLENISEDFAANFVPTTVSGASNMGRLWGFEVGLMATKTDAGSIEDISADSFSSLYNAALYGRLDVIYGLGAEVVMSPLKIGDLELKTYSMAVKWTLTEVFKVIPFNIKVKAFYNTADIKYSDNDGTADFDVSYKYQGKGVNVTFSKKIILVEPYIGIGYVDGESDIEANGSTNFFGGTVSQGVDNKDIESSGAHFFAGVTANLIAIDVGLEYSRVLGTNRVSGKIGFGF